ncbi:MAG: hypothetical protein VXW87_04165 [Pseudomonadota bacterium]|nr:hypothetical protein [Pseudomonadota bacterium]
MNQRRWVAPVIGMCVFISQAKSEQLLYGNIKLNDVVIDHPVKIIGLANVFHSTVNQDFSVLGVLKAKQSHFKNNIFVLGSNSSLESGEVDGSVLVTNYLRRPRIVLEDSVVKGKVIFKGVVKGCVQMDTNSRVHGGIENGEVC